MVEKRRAEHDQDEVAPAKKPRIGGVDRVSDLFAIPPGSGQHVRLIVGEGDEQESFYVPLDVLVKNSPVFEAMFKRMCLYPLLPLTPVDCVRNRWRANRRGRLRLT